jgi:predicted TIM-barrel fold metal-dependent hydrolase
MARWALLAAGLSTAAAAAATPAVTPFIDGHTHFDQKDIPGSVAAALAGLDKEDAAMVFLLPPPDTFDNPAHYDAEVILAAARQHPGKLAVMGGGGTLNAMIHQAVVSGDAGPKVLEAFRKRAEELAAEGIVGYGEMTAEHFAGGTPYQYAPADHPLFLLLADIGARHGLPIDLHLEAVPQTMPLPTGLKSPPNAPELHENIAAFERLLSHNPGENIVWAHAGTDGTGLRTAALCRRLLQAHPNLYMELKLDGSATAKNSPLTGGKVDPDWLKLFQDFPERFIIGSDQHYPELPGTQRWEAPVALLNQLPAALQKAIGKDNVLHIYKVTK